MDPSDTHNQVNSAPQATQTPSLPPEGGGEQKFYRPNVKYGLGGLAIAVLALAIKMPSNKPAGGIVFVIVMILIFLLGSGRSYMYYRKTKSVTYLLFPSVVAVFLVLYTAFGSTVTIKMAALLFGVASIVTLLKKSNAVITLNNSGITIDKSSATGIGGKQIYTAAWEEIGSISVQPMPLGIIIWTYLVIQLPETSPFFARYPNLSNGNSSLKNTFGSPMSIPVNGLSAKPQEIISLLEEYARAHGVQLTVPKSPINPIV